jgi:hypothetical protein
MQLRLERESSRAGSTLGRLSVDGCFECYTLEDVIRERAGVPVRDWKVKGATAIPAGRYRVILTKSPKFGRVLPELVDVPGFTAIRIHSGNRVTDTEGCPLVGQTRGLGFVGRSRAAEQALVDKLKAADGEIWITVENPAADVPMAVAA